MEDNSAICYNCGAEKGLHSWASDKCPKDGVETSAIEKREWEDTIFEDAKQRKLQDAAPKLLDELKCLVEMTKNHPDFIENEKNGQRWKAVSRSKEAIKEAE